MGFIDKLGKQGRGRGAKERAAAANGDAESPRAKSPALLEITNQQEAMRRHRRCCCELIETKCLIIVAMYKKLLEANSKLFLKKRS
jgi:hypothetical protein